jgi:hypothetical protein
MQTDLLISGGDNEADEAKHRARVLARRRTGFAMLEALRMELHRQRANGVEFGDAWEAATVAAVRQLTDPRERAAWHKALSETRPQWHGAYLRQPDTRVARVSALAETL